METRLIESSKRNCGYASSKLMKVKNSNKRITKRSIVKKKNDDNSNYKMKKVVVLKTQLQKLYESCQHVFRGPGTIPSPHHVQILRHIIDGMLPKDVGLSPDLHFFNPNNNSSNVKGAAGRVIQTTIYKCNNFSLCIFFLPAASVIPLHNHPGMTVFSKLLLGTMHIKAYDWVVDPIDHHDNVVSISPSKLRRLAKLKADDVFTAPCDSSVLYPASGGNIHAFTAITPCAVLDVIGPPYSSEDGRDCSYYKDTPYTTPQSNEERSMSMRKVEEEGAEEELYGWLEEIEMPKESTMVGIPYLGPQINDHFTF